MTDQALSEDIEEHGDEGGADGAGGAKKSSRRKLLLIALPVLLLGGGGAAVYFSGLADSLLRKEAPAEHAADKPAEVAHGNVYYELPQMLVNLSATNRRTSFLKIVVSLELTREEDKAKLDEALPRIVDNFQVYLRELRVEDMRGSAGLYRLREELLFRVNAAVSPVRVTDVLFKEMLVQ